MGKADLHNYTNRSDGNYEPEGWHWRFSTENMMQKREAG